MPVEMGSASAQRPAVRTAPASTTWIQVLGPSTHELMDRGYLTPYRTFVSDPPDLSSIKKNAEGDYRETDLAWS
jgi:hypothetical protein